MGLSPSQASAIGEAALEQTDKHAAARFLFEAMRTSDSPIPGLRNEGFLASHELEVGVPDGADWHAANATARGLLGARGRELIQRLGYLIEDDASGKHSILLAANRKAAVALYLNRDEAPEQAASRLSSATPISYGLAVADRENLDYVILTTPTAIRIYPSRPGVGVGQRSRTETYIDLAIELLPPDQAGYLWLLFSSEATKSGGTLLRILEASSRFRTALGGRLRERVYDDVIPGLATAIARARQTRKPSVDELQDTYQVALHHLFRLLFIAYAEDKDLLPYKTNEAYRTRSLKQKARELLGAKQSGLSYGDSPRLWSEIAALCSAIDKGDRTIGIPAYNGGLFSSDPAVSEEGARLSAVLLPDSVYAPILASLLIDKSDDGEGPVDFRSLGVQEFGTIYEGLLESELLYAEEDLSLDPKTLTYRPASGHDSVQVSAGSFYLASTSGTRKSTGSFFTKDFAVEHLLRQALEPALSDHLRRLDAIADPDQAADAFFDFRVADISMGSGHFLVAAVDHIEVRLSGYLARRELPAVRLELDRLRQAAAKAMSDLDSEEIEDSRLLRRQIARRCIYGVDVKPAAVELARVSVWIHTFVPGLPLSLLDQHLVVGNSLTGIATVDEAEALLTGDRIVEIRDKNGPHSGGTGRRAVAQQTLFNQSAKSLMTNAAEGMLAVGRLGDATSAEVLSAREEWEKARDSAAPWVALLDLLAATRIEPELRSESAVVYEEWRRSPPAIRAARPVKRAQALLSGLRPCHFPAVFPEAFFGRESPGFDVIVGNPPWEEATVEEDKFWIRVMPGLAGKSQREQEIDKATLRRKHPELVTRLDAAIGAAKNLREILTRSNYPGMGTGDPDLYKAFAWRFWRLLSRNGRLGVVLPRSALSAKGSSEWRKALFSEGRIDDLTFVLNTGGWVFDDAEPRYTIAFVAAQKADPGPSATIALRGPFRSQAEFDVGAHSPAIRLLLKDVLSWTDTAALPLLPDQNTLEVFVKLRRAPRLDTESGNWRVAPYSELHATADKKANGGIIEFPKTTSHGYWPVYGGESFDLWNPDTGAYYGWAESTTGLRYLLTKRRTSARRNGSPFSGIPERELNENRSLPCQFPRIAFRDVTNRTNRRTIIAALVPGRVFLTNKAPYFVWRRGDEKDQAYLLGVLASLPLDWYARRFVEVGVNFFIISPFPVPRPARDSLLWNRVVMISGRLASVDSRFAEWAKAVGVTCGPLTAEEKSEMVCELDAVVAHLYELSRDDIIRIFETFHEGWDYADRLSMTLSHFDSWAGRQ